MLLPYGLVISILRLLRYFAGNSKVLPRVLKIVRCLLVVIKRVKLIIKLSLSQISFILLEFTYFVFTIIDTHLPQRTQILSQHALQKIT